MALLKIWHVAFNQLKLTGYDHQGYDSMWIFYTA